MKLIHLETKKEVIPGETVTDFRGDQSEVGDPVGREPQHSASTGRIYVEGNGISAEYFPSVFDCAWVESEKDIHPPGYTGTKTQTEAELAERALRKLATELSEQIT